MARLQPNLNVIKMTGFAIAFTYVGAWVAADYLGLSTEEVTRQYPIQFYLSMAVVITLFLQGEIQDQKQARRDAEHEEEKRLQEERREAETTPEKGRSGSRKRGRKGGKPRQP